jgi:hypothetical protein
MTSRACGPPCHPHRLCQVKSLIIFAGWTSDRPSHHRLRICAPGYYRLGPAREAPPLVEKNRPVRNVWLWMELDELNRFHRTTWLWTEGHAAHAGNNRCDWLAQKFLPGQRPSRAASSRTRPRLRPAQPASRIIRSRNGRRRRERSGIRSGSTTLPRFLPAPRRSPRSEATRTPGLRSHAPPRPLPPQRPPVLTLLFVFLSASASRR